jgi:endo-1,4-beta-xylanase
MEPERTNHAEEQPELVERLVRLHEEWVEAVTPEPEIDAETGLCDVFQGDFRVGTIWHGPVLGSGERNRRRVEEMAVTQKEFNAITPENCMKPSFTQPEEGVFTFEEADEFVHRSGRMGQAIVGHTLVWKNDAPEWFFRNRTGGPASRELVIRRMTNHIQTVVSRYKGRIESWDVVNEAVDVLPNEAGEYEACLKPSPWLDLIGPDYIEIAYRAAHAADPEAKLLYNDYNMHDAGKVDFIVQMVKDLRARGVPMHGIGVQGHMFLDFPDLEELEHVFQVCTEAGIPISVTELDVSVLPNAWQHRGASIEDHFELAERFNPYPDDVPPAVLQQQAARYREIFRLLLKYSDTVERVTFWGIWDGHSWRNHKPMEGRTDYPLLFDREFRKKPAYHSIRGSD